MRWKSRARRSDEGRLSLGVAVRAALHQGRSAPRENIVMCDKGVIKEARTR